MASILMVPWQPLLVLKKKHSDFHTKRPSYSLIKNERTSSFNYKSTLNVPFYELPGVYQSFHPHLQI